MIEKEQKKSIIAFVKEMTGNVIDDSKEYLIESKISKILADQKIPTIEILINKLTSPGNDQLKYRVADLFTINETLFFRDHNPFDVLTTCLLPEVIKAREKSKKISIWSAACSTGQEIYSIAMLLQEHFPMLLEWKVNLFASDYSDNALALAKAGTYSNYDMKRGMPDELLQKYFTQGKNHWSINEEIRQKVNFSKINLTLPFAMFETFDIIFLRNVLIYFDVATKSHVLHRIRKCLAPDGYLFLGCSETLIKIDAPFTSKKMGQTNVYLPNPIR